jgi:hypothetical protein
MTLVWGMEEAGSRNAIEKCRIFGACNVGSEGEARLPRHVSERENGSSKK